jgi:hypothetical protein
VIAGRVMRVRKALSKASLVFFDIMKERELTTTINQTSSSILNLLEEVFAARTGT